jgi:hypothetical protein
MQTKRPKARGLAQHAGPPGWLDESDPAGVILYVMDGPYHLPFPYCTGCPDRNCYIVNVHNHPWWATLRKEGMAWYSSRPMASLWMQLPPLGKMTACYTLLTRDASPPPNSSCCYIAFALCMMWFKALIASHDSTHAVLWRAAKCHCLVADFWHFLWHVLSLKNIFYLPDYVITRKQHYNFLAAKSFLEIATGLR